MAQPSTHVTVIGAGVFGLATVLACVTRGHSVTVLEADRVGAGASGGIVGALSPHVPDRWNAKKRFQRDALLEAEAYWTRIAALTGEDTVYRRTGRLIPIGSEAARELALARIADARENWGVAADWDVLDAADPDWLSPEATAFGVVHETLTGRVFPRAAVDALATACCALGVEIREKCPVSQMTDIEGTIVIAAGVAGFALAGISGAKGIKGQAALLRPNRRGSGPVIYDDGVYVVPQQDGVVAVGSTSENGFDDPMATDSALEALIARARALCPALDGAEVVERWAGVRPRAPRRDPLIGLLPGSDRIFLALGGFKIGFGIAHKAAEVLAALIDGEPVDLPDSFRPEHHMKDRTHA